MNRYTTEDFEELGNIVEEICTEKKSNPFQFKKFKKNDEEETKSSKKKPSNNKKSKAEKVDEGYLVEFEENQGIPWQPINEVQDIDKVWGFDFDNNEDRAESRYDTEPDSNYEDDPFAPSPQQNKKKSLDDDAMEDGEVETIDDDTPEIGEDEDEDETPDENDETEDDYGYDDEDIEDTNRILNLARKNKSSSLNQEMDAADGDASDAGGTEENSSPDDSQADENGEGAPIPSVKYPVTLKFADGFEKTYGEDDFPVEAIISNLTHEHPSEEYGDSRIVDINGEPADEWAERNGVGGLVSPEDYDGEETTGDDDEGAPDFDIGQNAEETDEHSVNDDYFDFNDIDF